MERLRDEFQSYDGWIDRGNTVRKRTPAEQIRLMNDATRRKLRTIAVAGFDRDRIRMPFLSNAKTVDEYLPDATQKETDRVIADLLTDLHAAHAAGIVYGDRWSKNILVTRNGNPHVTHVDFDLQYEGPHARDMEVGRMMFYLLHAGRDKAAPMLAQGLLAARWFDPAIVANVLRGQADHFEGTAFGGMAPAVESLLGAVHVAKERGPSDLADAADRWLQTGDDACGDVMRTFRNDVRHLFLSKS